MGRWFGFSLAFLLTLAVSTPLRAGGAWPRGKGNVFVSLSWSSFGDVLGYLAALREPALEMPQLEMTSEIGTYAEVGLTERLTFGLDRHHRRDDDIGATILFLRAAVGPLDWSNRFSVEIGMGPYRDWRGIDETALRAGLAWGHGLETRWGDGWVDVDAKIASLSDSDLYFWKVDSTIGLTPGEHSLWYLQLQSGGLEGFPAYTKLTPTYVRRLGHGFSLESALLVGLKNDETLGVKIGAWLEF